MGLSVIGAGLWRTGTMSLKVGLEQLGFGPCHHMEELFADPTQVPPWQAAVAGEPTNWDAVFAGYNSTTDYPGAFFWRELAEFYPDAKVVLTVRTSESWWESYSSTIMKFLQNVPDDVLPHIGEICEMSKVLIGEKTFQAALDDEAAGLAAFHNHIENVSDSISSDRFLCFDVKDGWEPLCEFLDKPVPDVEFPRRNSSVEFWENFSPTR